MTLLCTTATFVRQAEDIVIQTGAATMGNHAAILKSLQQTFDHAERDAEFARNCSSGQISGGPQDSADHGFQKGLRQTQLMHCRRI
jgi:hypothetical protein